jgi:hypothetical protein
MAKANIVRLADNIPLTIAAKYCDVFVGEHGPDLRFKGTIDTVPNSCAYVNFTHGLEQLRAIGAVTDKAYNDAVAAVEKESVPDTGLSVGLTKRNLVILREKPAGAKHGTIRITLEGQQAAPAPGPAPAAAAANGSATSETTPTNGNGNAAREKRSTLYRTMTAFVLDKIVPMYTEKNITVAANDVHSMVATLYIAETRN